MKEITVYLELNKKAELNKDIVRLEDVAKLWCEDCRVSGKCKSLTLHCFAQNSDNRKVIDCLDIVKKMKMACPEIQVEVVGEPRVLVERAKNRGIGKKDKPGEAGKTGETGKSGISHMGGMTLCKILTVMAVCFFGTAFTIMAYHNDIGINEMFEDVYEIFMNTKPQGINVLQVSYSIGLFLGIVLFFNHVGGRRLTKDPTPIEVAMYQYEQDVNDTLIATGEEENAG